MANENLKHALSHAGLTAEQFAQIIEVDPKTVHRRVTGRTPYPRRRATVARALELTEHELWPDDVPPDGDEPTRSDHDQAVGDVVGSWGHATDPGVPNIVELIAHAKRRIDVRHDGRRLRFSDAIITAILERVSAGCQIRIVTEAPTRELAPLVSLDRTEIRVTTMFSDHAMVRVDDDMLLYFLLVSDQQRSPAVLYLHRRSDGGLFDRFTAHRDAERARANPPLTDPDQLASDSTDAADASHQPDRAAADGLDAATDTTDQPSSPAAETQAPRRCPRRAT